jgi:hypothetical protein
MKIGIGLHESYIKFRLGSGTRAGGDGSQLSEPIQSIWVIIELKDILTSGSDGLQSQKGIMSKVQ